MGACLSKKQGSSSTSTPPVTASKLVSTTPPSKLKNPENGVTITLPKPTNPEVNNLKKEKKTTDPAVAAPAQQVVETQVKKEIFIIKHRKSHDENRERGSKIQPFNAQQNVAAHSDDGSPSDSAESMGNSNNKIAPPTPNMGGVVRTSSCTKEDVDAILIQCGRLSRSSSGRAATSSSGVERGRKYSGSKRSFDFDHCENDSTSADGDQKRATDNNSNSDLCEDYDGAAAAEKGGCRSGHQHRQRHRQSPRPSSPSSQGGGGRRRTPSRERDQRSSSRERRVSRSPGRRSSETTTNGSNGCNNNNSSTGSRPGKMVSVPATVTSLVMDKSNNGGGESAGVKRITVKRNVGAGDGGVVGSRGSASPRSQSPARGNGNAANGRVLSENQQQPSLSRNNSARKAEHSPYRRNPLSEIDPNSLAYPQSNANNGSSKMQNKPKKETEAEANQKPYAMDRGVSVNCKPKEQQEEDTKTMASMNDINNVVVKALVPSSIIDNNNITKPQSLTRSRSSRRSRDLDINPESLLNNNPPPAQSYTSLLLEDIQNFHQKNTQQQQPQQQPSPSISLPACLSKACSILEAVADLNSTTSSNNNVSFGGANNNSNHYGKRVVAYDAKDPFVESEVLVSDDVMEPSFHKYVTVKRGGSVLGVDMEDQESSGSNSFTVSSGQQQQQHWGGIGISTSSWEPNSADSTDDCSWTSRLMMTEGGSDDVIGAKRNKNVLKCKRRECDDHQHSSGIGRGRIVVTAASTT